MFPYAGEALQSWWVRLWSRYGSAIKRGLIATAIGAVLFYLAVLIFPRLLALFWYGDIKRLLYEDIGFSEAWATVFSIVLSFIYAAAWAPLMIWTLRTPFWHFNPRKVALGFIGTVIIYGHMPLAHALFGSEACVNQSTGEPLKWYYIDLTGQIVLRDSPGFESKIGTTRRPATVQICRIHQLQARGIKPNAVTTDPRSLTFFNDITGQPRIWYYKAANGQIDLFDAEGTHPVIGEPLKPVTREIAQEARDRAQRAEQAKVTQERERLEEAERAARLKAERDKVEAKDNARTALVDLFGVASYATGTVIVGVVPRQKDEASFEAAQQLLKAMITNLRNKGVAVGEFAPKVYSSGQFDSMISGGTAVLVETGLAQKMRAALLTGVEATCRQATGLTGVNTCSVAIDLRVVGPAGTSSLYHWSETGAGTNTAQAIARATELFVERNPGWLNGI